MGYKTKTFPKPWQAESGLEMIHNRHAEKFYALALTHSLPNEIIAS